MKAVALIVGGFLAVYGLLMVTILWVMWP